MVRVPVPTTVSVAAKVPEFNDWLTARLETSRAYVPVATSPLLAVEMLATLDWLDEEV